jgi:hypothetical protein
LTHNTNHNLSLFPSQKLSFVPLFLDSLSPLFKECLLSVKECLLGGPHLAAAMLIFLPHLQSLLLFYVTITAVCTVEIAPHCSIFFKLHCNQHWIHFSCILLISLYNLKSCLYMPSVWRLLFVSKTGTVGKSYWDFIGIYWKVVYSMCNVLFVWLCLDNFSRQHNSPADSILSDIYSQFKHYKW